MHSFTFRECHVILCTSYGLDNYVSPLRSEGATLRFQCAGLCARCQAQGDVKRKPEFFYEMRSEFFCRCNVWRSLGTLDSAW